VKNPEWVFLIPMIVGIVINYIWKKSG